MCAAASLFAAGRVECSGKDVLDIGACIGDTAIYFVLSGAKHVYAVEPYPATFKAMLRNIDANGLGSRITPLNLGIGNADTKIMLTDKGSDRPGNQSLHDMRQGKQVPVFTLSSIMRRLKLDDCVLKMDCEGMEYDIILSSSDSTLRAFSQIILEYHFGHENLARRLEKAGFRVKLLDAPHSPALIDD